VTAPRVSVLIRSKDEEASIGRTLELVAAQSVPHQVIVVDSGSGDATPEIARAAGAQVIEIPAPSFTFGGSLNKGCAAATGEIVVALSAHAFPPDPGWLERMLAPFADERVACACGQEFSPDGDPLAGPVRQDAALARRRPTWGYSNAAGAFRRELWEQRPFRADLPATEDKEWALHWLDRGYLCVLSPELLVEHDHSKDGMLDQYRRAEREWRGIAMMIGDLPRYPVGDLVREWWLDQGSYRSPARARLSHRRLARLVGEYMGRREHL